MPEEILEKRWWADYPYIPYCTSNIFRTFKIPYSVYSIVDDFWINHIAWRIAHYIQGQRCENCPNWHERKTISKSRWGWCDLYSPIATLERRDDTIYINPTIHEHYHSWCPAWGVGINDSSEWNPRLRERLQRPRQAHHWKRYHRGVQWPVPPHGHYPCGPTARVRPQT